MLFKLLKFLGKAFVWTDNLPLTSDEFPSLIEGHPEFFHQKGNDKGRASGDTHLAMYEHVVILQLVSDEGVGVLKMRVDAFFFDVLQVYPFMMIYPMAFDLMLHLEVIVSPLINDCQHAVDTQIFSHFWVLKNIDPTQIEVAFVRWDFNPFEYVHDVTALFVQIPHLLAKEL